MSSVLIIPKLKRVQRQVIQLQGFLNTLNNSNGSLSARVVNQDGRTSVPGVICRKLGCTSQETTSMFIHNSCPFAVLESPHVGSVKQLLWRCAVSFCSASSEVPLNRKDVLGFIESEEDFDTFLSQILSALKLEQKVQSYPASLQNLRVFVQKLVALGSDTRNIFAFLEAHPKILGVKSERILQNIDYLNELGLNWKRLLKVLDEPSTWTTSLQHLQDRVKHLRKLGFVEGSLQKVIGEWPKVLTIKSSKFKAVVKVLMENCGFSKTDLLMILSDSPSILADDPEDIELKFQYVYFRMGITNNSEMTQAKIYKYCLDHIRCRHLMLERMGLYAAPDNRGRFAMRNPKLARIVDSSDNRFAEKVASVCVTELHAFARTLHEEILLEKRRGGDDSSSRYSTGLSDDSDEDGSYDSSDDTNDDSDNGSDEELYSSEEEGGDTQLFDFDKVDYRKK